MSGLRNYENLGDLDDTASDIQVVDTEGATEIQMTITITREQTDAPPEILACILLLCLVFVVSMTRKRRKK